MPISAERSVHRVISTTTLSGVRRRPNRSVALSLIHISELKQVSEGVVGFPDEARQATLRFGRLRTPLSVVVEMTRWTDRSVEIGIRPPRHLPFWVSGDRYVRAAYAVLDRLARTLTSHAADTLADLEQLQKSA